MLSPCVPNKINYHVIQFPHGQEGWKYHRSMPRKAVTPFYGKSGAFNYSTNIFYDYRVPSAILDTLGREDGDRKRKTSLCSHGFTLTSAWMICGQLEPLSDPSSLLLCTPALPALAERLMVSSIYRLSSLQLSRSVVSDSLRPHELQHAGPPCPSPTPRVYPTHVLWVGDAI